MDREGTTDDDSASVASVASESSTDSNSAEEIQHPSGSEAAAAPERPTGALGPPLATPLRVLKLY